MTQAQKSSVTKQEEQDKTLVEFARRVMDGEKTADVFGLDDRFVDEVIQKAYNFYMDRKFEQAEVLARGATALDTTRAYPHKLLGDILLQRAAFEEAAEELEKALKSEPDHPMSLAKLGEAYLRLGRPDKATELLNQAKEEFEEAHPHLKRIEALLSTAQSQS